MHLDRSHREYFWLLVRRDLKVRYAGSSLGAMWNMIHPLMMIIIYMTIFSSIMGSRMGRGGAGLLVDYGRLDYGVHLCAGLIPWLLFSDVLTRSTNVLIENATFLKKTSFPPIVLFTSLLFNAWVIQGAAFVCFIGILYALGMPVPPQAFAGLGLMALLGLVGMGLGLVLAGLNVFFRDAGQILMVVMQLLFWFNPIVYKKELIFGNAKPAGDLTLLERFGRLLIQLNPLERFISGIQSLFGVTAPPALGDWVIIVLVPIVSLLGGLYIFRRMLPDARDNI